MMKRILTMMLAIACLFSLTACGGLAEEDAREVAEKFMDAWTEMDFDEMKKYVDDEDELPERFSKFEGLDAKKAEIMDTLPAQFADYKESMGKIVDKILDKFLSTVEYEIKESKETEDGYEFTVEITSVDEDADIGETFKEQLSGSMDPETLNGLVSKLMQEGKITASSTQKEVMDAIMPDFLKIMEDAIDDFEVETDTKEYTLVVYETEEGDVLVNAKKSDLED